MDFRIVLHDELATYLPLEARRREAECIGLLRSGAIRRRNGSLFLFLSHSSLGFLKKCLLLTKEFFPYLSYRLFLSEEKGIRVGLFYNLEIGVCEETIKNLGFYDLHPLFGRLSEEVASDFIRGIFELRGYVADPWKSYQLEMHFPSEEWATFVRSYLEGLDMPFRCRPVKSEWHLYTKNVTTMSLFLGYIGMAKSCLELEKIRLEKETMGHLTRWVNYATSNLERTIASSLRQRAKIRWIPPDVLPPKLREIALLRLRYPYASLRELGMYCSPPVSKGEVYRRLKALEEEAERFLQKEPESEKGFTEE